MSSFAIIKHLFTSGISIHTFPLDVTKYYTLGGVENLIFFSITAGQKYLVICISQRHFLFTF